MTLIGMPFCQAIYKGVEGNEWEELYEHCKEMSKAAGVRKPIESQKARAVGKDSPVQNIVTGLRERSREGIMNGLRSFIGLDNHKAVEVGHLRKGLRPFKVKKKRK